MSITIKKTRVRIIAINLVSKKLLLSLILWQLLKVLISVLNPFDDRSNEKITPKDNRPPLLVSTKSRIVFSAMLYIFRGITPSRKKRIFVESISGINEFIYGIKVKRNIIKGNVAIVKLNATANDLSNISSSANFLINIL